MTEIEVLRKAHLTRLIRQGRSSCSLPTCQRSFQEGDLIKRLGQKFYHAACELKAYMDYEEVKA